MMMIKVCGMKFPENIQSVAALQPDYLGLIFYAKSPRYAAALSAQELQMLLLLPKKVGVFVDEELPKIQGIIQQYQLQAVQLHGNESPEMCAILKKQVEVFKAFGVDEAFDFEQIKPYENVVDYFLFDTKTSSHGGSGKTFNWQVLQNYQLKTPFFISGGLSNENLEEVLKLKHPAFVGVDLNSRFETAPGLKNIEKLSEAFGLIKAQTALLPSA
jgi:phosphoribosylanthranilate isomerase